MILALHGLVDKYSHICDIILGSPIIHTLTSTSFALLHIPSKPINYTPIFVDDSCTLASQNTMIATTFASREKKHHKFDHYGRIGYKIDKCYELHGHPPRSDVVVQTAPPS